jgi:hypothetical protein
MMKTYLLIGMASVALLASPAAAQKPATTTPVAKKLSWPAPVEKAFKAAYPKATILNVSKETEDGATQYEVESMDGAQRRDLVYKPDGTLVLYEELIAGHDVPDAVVKAIKARYPKATLGAAEKLFKDKTMNYEVALKGAGKVTEVVLTPDGKWVEPKG